MRGFFFAPASTEIEIGLPSRLDKAALYIDGVETSGTQTAGRVSLTLPSGKHQWELTLGQPEPLVPRIDRTEYTVCLLYTSLLLHTICEIVETRL